MTDLKKKNVLIINQYASTPDIGMGGRCYYLSKGLADLGWNVSLISSQNHHLIREEKKNVKPRKEFINDAFSILWLSFLNYSNPRSFIRILNWFLFSISIVFNYKKVCSHPDVIIYSSPSIVPLLAAQFIAWRNKSLLVLDVRDVWPKTLSELGALKSKSIAYKFMQIIEDNGYKKSRIITSNLKNLSNHILERGGDVNKFYWIPNGYDKDEIQLSEANSSDIYKISELKKKRFVVGYVGTIGFANSLENLIYAARIINGKNINISIVLVGEGSAKKSLMKKAKELGCNNIYFLNSVKKHQVFSILKHFDACYIGWRDSNLYRYGIGANKIPEYMISGKPIIHAYSGSCDPIADSNCGITIPAENPEALSDAMIQLKERDLTDLADMGQNGIKYAQSNYSYEAISKKLSGKLLSALRGS